MTDDDLGQWLKGEPAAIQRAVVARGAHGAVILWSTGTVLSHMLEQALDVDEIGIDQPDAFGLYVYEGTFHTAGPDPNGEYDEWWTGAARAPTADEWRAIQNGRSPWSA